MPLNALERSCWQMLPRPRKTGKRSRRAMFWKQLECLEDRALLSAISPVQMRQAYGIDKIQFGAAGIPGNGAGQTIGIIEIGTDASLASDLQYFDQQLFGSGANGAQLLDTFGSYAGPVSGSTKPWFDTIQDPNFPPSVGTAKQDLEAALDVEWAHVIAPMANIVVVQTASNQSGAAYVASQTQLGVSTVASSYYLFPNLNRANYSQPNVAFVGITGDTGTSINSQQVGFTLNNFPASSPAIIAVGGTTLTLNADGSYGSETGWGFAGPDRFLTADQAYIAPGFWNAVSGGFSGTYYASPGPSGSTSTVWSTTITSSDVLGKNDSGLELSTTWTPSPSNADNAQYEIYDDGNLVETVTVNQQLAPNGTPGTLNSRTATFQELAALTKVSVGDTIQIVIPAQDADGSVVIDAIGLGPDDASGGGLSNNPQPSFQSGLVIHDGNSIISSNGTRANPDVAFDGDYINSPVEIYNQGAVQLAAGTSLGAPAWAALLAIADQGLALSGQPAMSTATALAGLYNLPSYDFHDETSGYNGYSAGPGYDLVTGLGSPVANQLIPALDNTVSPVSGPLTYVATEGQGPVSLQVVEVGTNIEILDANHNYDVVASASAAVTTGIDIVGAGNTSNTLTLDFGPFSPSDPFYQPNLAYPTGIPVTFDGGSANGGDGTLILEGGTFTSEIDTDSGAHSGSVTLDGTSITYTNLAPIIDTTTVATLIINDSLPGDTVTVEDDPNSPENGFATSEISGSGFEKIDLANKTNVIFNNTSPVTDTFDRVDPLVGNATLTINQAPAITNGPATSPAILDTAYSFQYTTTGSPAATFTLVPGSALPTGLTLSSTGVLSGTDTNPAEVGRTFTGSVDAGNGIGNDAIQAYSITVNPAPVSHPSVKILAPLRLVVPGEPAPLLIFVSDTNATAQAAEFHLSISFGDGTTKMLTSKSPLLVNHVFQHPGTFTVTVTATDEYGHVSAATRVTIKVLFLTLEPFPFNKSQTALFVGGAPGNDAVIFAASTSGIAVTLDGVNEGVYSTTGPLVVSGQGGKDTVKESPGLKNAIYLLESRAADNIEADLDDQAIQWAGVSAAMSILST
jgi:PKD domain/Putative Ig domain